MSTFPSISTLELGEDLQYSSLNLLYLRAITTFYRTPPAPQVNGGVAVVVENENQENAPLINNQEIVEIENSENAEEKMADNLSKMCTSLRNLYISVSHSMMLTFLNDIDAPLEKLGITLGKEQNMAIQWDAISKRLDTVLNKFQNTLIHLEVDTYSIRHYYFILWFMQY